MLSNAKFSKKSNKSNIIRLTIIIFHLCCIRNCFQKINLICLINSTRFVFLSILYKFWEFESRSILKRAWAIWLSFNKIINYIKKYDDEYDKFFETKFRHVLNENFVFSKSSRKNNYFKLYSFSRIVLIILSIIFN